MLEDHVQVLLVPGHIRQVYDTTRPSRSCQFTSAMAIPYNEAAARRIFVLKEADAFPAEQHRLTARRRQFTGAKRRASNRRLWRTSPHYPAGRDKPGNFP